MVGFIAKPTIFCVIARPQCGRGNLKAEGMASRSEARKHEARRNPYHKKHGFPSFILLPRSSFQGFVSFRATIVRFGMANRSVKDCRVGRKSCARLAMTNLVGFAKKRNNFRNETFEKRYRAIPRKNCARRGNDRKLAGFMKKPASF